MTQNAMRRIDTSYHEGGYAVCTCRAAAARVIAHAQLDRPVYNRPNVYCRSST